MVDPVALQENGMLLAFGDPGPMPSFLIRRQPGCTRKEGAPPCGEPDQYGWSCCGHGKKEPNVPKEKPIVWSYTLLHTYDDICPHQAYRRYILKDIPAQAMTEAGKRGRDVHTALEYRVGGGKPLPVDMQAYEHFAANYDGRGAKTEIKLGITADRNSCDFFNSNVWGRGVIDVALGTTTTAYIADWKTGGSKYESRFELDVQAVLLKAAYPSLTKIFGQYIWLAEDRAGTLYDLSDTDKAWQQIRDIMYKVEQDKLNESFEKRQGPLCKWCPVGNCEHNKNPELG